MSFLKIFFFFPINPIQTNPKPIERKKKKERWKSEDEKKWEKEGRKKVSRQLSINYRKNEGITKILLMKSNIKVRM